MSTITSCTLLRSVTAVRPAISSGRQLQSRKPAAVASLSSQWRSRPLSVCRAISRKGEHNPKTDLHPFNIPAFVLVHPVSPREERWQVEEEPGKVNLWFEVPGQSREDLAVEIDEDVLVIKKKLHAVAGDVGQRNTGDNRRSTAATGEAGKEAAQDGEVIYARLLLPAGYSKEGVEAELKSGVLRVSIAKIKEQARRKISVDIVVK
ncbi:small heat shock protein, chloroplastic-like isoform X3 [Panicum virgatum]|uniref:small heat shock protein, chloroplastic-like isoform X3 n=1 Tax=Panicum virgatum TaxID=38727 RepID=UPI0019D60881|nr:small heat shock protein, chloroplastic-like isoform X3 [Panicum virgatum]